MVRSKMQAAPKIGAGRRSAIRRSWASSNWPSGGNFPCSRISGKAVRA